ncbi:MAG: primosomal protein N' [Eubacterium sp.]|nr:primosomal protein N' [Eubacterium sp.]
MSERYADIIIDISESSVDRPFRYRIPENLYNDVKVGSVVKVPFGKGNSERTGYVIGLALEPNYDINKIKNIIEVARGAISVESKLIQLAAWMRENYGGTMITALKTVMPVKQKVRETKAKVDIRETIPEFSPIDSLEAQQQAAVDTFVGDLKNIDQSSETNIYLLHGVTGSGKTEVYIKMAEEVIARGQEVIVLVPEIALTYQTVARFSSYFQNSISILNSQLSKGEKYREFMKARDGETHIMIGPRSALFAPFQNLGLIIIDEEHDGAYKSEQTPKYHAREVAIERARLEGAKVVLGSATPSIGSYYKAINGEYKLLTLTERVKGALLPEVEIVDLRAELKAGNRNIISRSLATKLEDAFERGEQAMLFINRRGYNSFVSCRSCGTVIKCPNCDVSLSLHGKNKLMCHYCGYVDYMPNRCPSCQSNLIGGCGAGTEMLEEAVQKLFPDIKTLRMDRDTTTTKGSHGTIIKKFREGKAQCLIGTQMIVKGHDFPKVTVVGNILADLGLFDSDFEAAERTYDLLTQAAGRAGRGQIPGQVVIQTYQPEHYAITTAAAQDYKSFFEYEMSYRKLLHFPPVFELLAVLISCSDEEVLISAANMISADMKKYMNAIEKESANDGQEAVIFDMVGPAQAMIYRINNVYRLVIYVKSERYDRLIDVTREADNSYNTFLEMVYNQVSGFRGLNPARTKDLEIQYDFNPMRII